MIDLELCCIQVQLINDAYNLVIDAMLGPEADIGNIKEPYSGILGTLKQVKIPIASVDVPSGRSRPCPIKSFSDLIYGCLGGSPVGAGQTERRALSLDMWR